MKVTQLSPIFILQSPSSVLHRWRSDSRLKLNVDSCGELFTNGAHAWHTRIAKRFVLLGLDLALGQSHHASFPGRSRMFEFVFRMFATGEAVIPANGMEAMARQIAEQLLTGSVRTGASVESLDGTTVRLASGELLRSEAIVVACEAPAAAKVIGEPAKPTGQSVTCLYFAAKHPPIKEPILVLNGDGDGPINNLCACLLYTSPSPRD